MTDKDWCDCTSLETGTQRLVPFTVSDMRAAIAAERERCALIAENAMFAMSPGPLYSAGFVAAKNFIADRIRQS